MASVLSTKKTSIFLSLSLWQPLCRVLFRHDLHELFLFKKPPRLTAIIPEPSCLKNENSLPPSFSSCLQIHTRKIRTIIKILETIIIVTWTLRGRRMYRPKQFVPCWTMSHDIVERGTNQLGLLQLYLELPQLSTL